MVCKPSQSYQIMSTDMAVFREFNFETITSYKYYPQTLFQVHKKINYGYLKASEALHALFDLLFVYQDMETLEPNSSTEMTTEQAGPASLFRRHISQSLIAAHRFRDTVLETQPGEELISRLPTLQNRNRRIQRDTRDKRRNQCLRVRFTALDKPSYRNTANIHYDVLEEKGLGRRDDTMVQLQLECDYVGMKNKAKELFPVLEQYDFDLFLGKRSCQLEEIESPCTVKDLKEKIPKKGFARVWIKPRTEILHVMMGTPTVLGRQQRVARQEEVPEIQTEASQNIQHEVQEHDQSQETQTAAQEIHNAEHNSYEQTIQVQTTTSSPRESLTLELDRSDEDDLQIGFQRMKDTVQGESQTMFLNRTTLMMDILNLYRDNLVDIQRPIRVEVEGETGEDLGGMTEDMFSQFWDAAFDHYFHGNEVSVPFLPPNRRSEASHVFPALGKALEQMLSLTGRFPARMARTGLLVLSSPDLDLPTDLLINDYLRFLPAPTTALVQRLLRQPSWRDIDKRELTLFFSASGMSCIPTPSNLLQSMESLAQVELVDKPATLYRLIRRGTSPLFQDQLLGRIHQGNVERIFDNYQVCPEKLAELIMNSIEEMDLQPLEQVVSIHLLNVVREWSQEDLGLLVRWVTGSSVMPQNFKLMFNGTSGLNRTPVAHTCGNILELPTGYDTYRDFKDELLRVIHSEEAWKWTTL